MIYTENGKTSVEDVQDMIFWYKFIIQDILTDMEKGNHKKAYKMTKAILKILNEEYHHQLSKNVFEKYCDDDLFLAYSRLIKELKHLKPFILTNKNVYRFCDDALGLIQFINNYIDHHIVLPVSI